MVCFERCDHEIASFKDEKLKAGGAQNTDGNHFQLMSHKQKNYQIMHAFELRSHCERNAHQTPNTTNQFPRTSQTKHWGGKEQISHGPPTPPDGEKHFHERIE